MKTSEFSVESMKHCFICLDPILSPSLVDPDHEPESQSSFSIYSLWSLSSYLRIDMGKVFHDNDSIPQHLLDQVRKSKLKGELCDECSLMNDRFSELYWKMLKIKMEVASSVKLIQSKFLKANEAGKSTKLREAVNSMPNLSAGKLDILEVLRAEAIEKCSMKLRKHYSPRVKVENLSMEQVNLETKKFKRDSSMKPGGQTANFEAKSDPALDSRYCKVDYSDQDQGDEDNKSYYQEDMHSSHGMEGSATSMVDVVDDSECSTDEFSNNQPKIRKAEKYNDDLTNVTYSFEIVIPSESQNVEKPHPRVDPKSRKHKCNLCPKEFSNQTNFKTHYDSAHLKVKYKCTICGIQFTQLGQYKIHHQSGHLGVKFKCRHCNKIFKQKASLWRHQRICNNST